MVDIIGAGYAGLSAALALNQAGIKSTIYERKFSVGASELENYKAVRNYDMGVDLLDYLKNAGLKVDSSAFHPIHKITKYAPSGKKMTVFSKDKPVFYAVKKATSKDSLDYQLYSQAESEGIPVLFNQNKNLISGDIIAANSIYRNIWAYGYHCVDVNVETDEILFFMDNNYAPNGYIYVIPFKDQGAVIAATSFDLSANLPQLFGNFIAENPIIQNVLEGSTLINKFSGSAYCNVPKTAEFGGKKFVGASAGFVEAARGFGVRYAIQSGLMASKAITEKVDYDSLWKAAFEKDLAEGLKRRFLLEKMSNEEYEKLVIDDKISIQKYDKYPGVFKDWLLSLEYSAKLKDWQSKFDLAKLFSN